MAPAPNSTPLPSPLASWALPATAAVLVAGSLVFWTCLGLFWLAARPNTPQPIVVWMPPVTQAVAADQINQSPVHSSVAAQDR